MSCALLNLLVRNQKIGRVQLRLHPLVVRDEVRAEIAAIQLHTLDILGLELKTLALFNGDDAVLADLGHHFGDQVANLVVRC